MIDARAFERPPFTTGWDEDLPQMQQNPNELEQLLRMMEQRPPERILEIGVFGGGTLTRFARRFPEARVVGIDPSPSLEREPMNAKIICGESQHPLVRSQAIEALGGLPDFVHIDGAHDEASCSSDLSWCVEMEVPLVAFHDIAARNHPALEVWKVWDALQYQTDPPQLLTISYDEDWNGIGVWDRRGLR